MRSKSFTAEMMLRRALALLFVGFSVYFLATHYEHSVQGFDNTASYFIKIVSYF